MWACAVRVRVRVCACSCAAGDGALSMEALQKTAPSFDAVKDQLASYAK